jgi:hypothetical protein
VRKVLPKDNYPYLSEPNHIYNKFKNLGIWKVDLGWDSFEFELVPNLTDDGDKLDGLTCFSSRTVKLEMGLSNKDAKETIMHELLHCLLAGMGLEELNFDGERFCVTNEFLVCSLTRQLQTLNNLNPNIMSLIYERNSA